MSPLEHIATIPGLRDLDQSDIVIEPLLGLTNHSYRVAVGGERYVLRIPGPGTEHYIDRQREAHNTRVAARAGIGPDVLWENADRGAMLCRHIDGTRPLSNQDFQDGATLRRAAALLHRLHGTADEFQGQLLPAETFQRYVDLARQHHSPYTKPLIKLRRDSGDLRGAFEHSTRNTNLVPCHVDPVPANFVADATRFWLLDWEYAAMAHPMWDLACMALETGLSAQQQTRLLKHYFASLDHDLETRFQEHLLMVSAVGLAWVAVQLAVGNTGADFDSEFRRRLDRLSSMLATVSCAR